MPRPAATDAIRVHDPADGQLPLTHATDAFTLRDVMGTDRLCTQTCSVFKEEKLLYCFLGRASYRSNADAAPNALISLAPVCFILAPVVGNNPKRIFPFDTGGFPLFESGIHYGMGLLDFELDVNNDSARRVINVLFGSNKNYIYGDPRTDLKIPSMEFEAESFHALILVKLRNAYDDRVSAIEIQLDKDVQLTGTVEAVVLPGVLLDDPNVTAKLTAWGAKPLPYEWLKRLKPTEYVSQIASIVRDYLVNSARM
jgi:hypothetical protein